MSSLLTPNALDLTTLADVKTWASLQGGVVDTTIPLAISPGNGVVVTPATMANIAVGSDLWVDSGVNRESVKVAAVTSSTFTANFALAHAAASVGPPVVPATPVCTAQDGLLAGMITAASLYWLRKTGRVHVDGSTPATSSLVEQVTCGPEWYDGNGNDRLFLRLWPIVSVSELSINGLAIPASTSITAPGFVIDQGGKCLAMRSFGGGWNVSTWRSRYARPYCFARGTQNVEVSYVAGFNGVPDDVAEKCCKMVVLTFKRRGWVDQSSQMIPQAGTISYRSWIFDPDILAVMDAYQTIPVF
jgi:hypothetical protein